MRLLLLPTLLALAVLPFVLSSSQSMSMSPGTYKGTNIIATLIYRGDDTCWKKDYLPHDKDYAIVLINTDCSVEFTMDLDGKINHKIK